MPLSGLAICAVGDRVVVREGVNRWQAESGQYLLALESDRGVDLRVVEPPTRRAFGRRLLRAGDGAGRFQTPKRRCELYARGDRRRRDAWPRASISAGCCTSSGAAEAERVYRAAIAAGATTAAALQPRRAARGPRPQSRSAATPTKSLLRNDPRHIDALHNAGLLADELGRGRRMRFATGAVSTARRQVKVTARNTAGVAAGLDAREGLPRRRVG